MTVIYVILFLTGVVGNIAVCMVIIRNRSMHTATNYYLFSLAVSDLIILLLGKDRATILQFVIAIESNTMRSDGRSRPF